MKTAFIHIEMDVPLLEIRRNGLPDLHHWMQLFHSTPCRITDALAVEAVFFVKVRQDAFSRRNQMHADHALRFYVGKTPF